MSISLDYRTVGGRPIYLGGTEVWDFGWRPPQVRSPEENEALAKLTLPALSISGATQYPKAGEKILLSDLWKHQSVVQAIGFEFPGFIQHTGSCVGVSSGGVCFTTLTVEVVRLGDPEQILVPFWPLPYGRGRFHSGINGSGEGSSGTGQAEAYREDGVVPFATDGLPTFSIKDGMLSVGSSVEMEWSNGAKVSQKWLEQSRKHPIKSTALCRNADAVREAIVNGYAVTEASMYGFNAKVEGNPAVLLGRRGPRWAHQMFLLGWWEHPQLGELFFLMNQWGASAHGKDPAGGPSGGVWITKADVDWFCQEQETYAYSQFQGFPAQNVLDWLLWT